MVFGVKWVFRGVIQALGIPEIAVATFFFGHVEFRSLVIADGQVKNVCAIALFVAKFIMESHFNPILTIIIGFPCDGPIIEVACHFCHLVVVFLMEPEIKPMLDGATAIGVVKDDFIVGVFMISDARLVPIPTGGRSVRETLILVKYGRHLVLVDRKHQFLHLQASVVVDSVEISDLAILVIERSVKVVNISDTDSLIYKCRIVGRIDRQVEPDNTVAAMDALIGIGHLTRMVV